MYADRGEAVPRTYRPWLHIYQVRHSHSDIDRVTGYLSRKSVVIIIDGRAQLRRHSRRKAQAMNEFEQSEVTGLRYGSWPEVALVAMSFVMIVIGGLLAYLPVP